MATPHDLTLLSAQLAEKKKSLAGGPSGAFHHRKVELLYDARSSDEGELVGGSSSTEEEESTREDTVITVAPPHPTLTRIEPYIPRKLGHTTAGSDALLPAEDTRKKQTPTDPARGKKGGGSGGGGGGGGGGGWVGGGGGRTNGSSGLKRLSSLFVGGAESGLDSGIADSVGLEQLTRLARATSARIVVHTLTLDTEALDRLIIGSSSNRNTGGVRNMKQGGGGGGGSLVQPFSAACADSCLR